jgi:hypothetical protein
MNPYQNLLLKHTADFHSHFHQDRSRSLGAIICEHTKVRLTGSSNFLEGFINTLTLMDVFTEVLYHKSLPIRLTLSIPTYLNETA